MSVTLLLPPVIILSGGYFIFKLRRYFFNPASMLRRAFGGADIRDGIRAFTLALSGTLGVGNIVGVLTAISVGGAGSVFWMMISAVFSAVLKYAESSLSADTGGGIGMITAIKRAFGNKCARLYAALATLLALTMGSALQSGAVRESTLGMSAPLLPIAIPVLLLCVTVTACGKGWIMRATEMLLPFAMVIYSILCLGIIIPRAHLLPYAVSNILRCALTRGAATGGIGGFIVSHGIRSGFCCGMLSNEAGAGTSAFSHTALDTQSPIRCGIFGYLEVIFDTVILCTLTALAAILGGIGDGSCSLIRFSALLSRNIPAGGIMLLGCCVTFAVCAALCWHYYGTVCMRYLFGKVGAAVFMPCFLAAFTAGLIFKLEFLVPLCDTVLTLMTLITVATLIKSSERIVSLSEPSATLK